MDKEEFAGELNRAVELLCKRRDEYQAILKERDNIDTKLSKGELGLLAAVDDMVVLLVNGKYAKAQGISLNDVKEVFGEENIKSITYEEKIVEKKETPDIVENKEGSSNSGDYMVTFGRKHNGKTLREIYDTDPQYIAWIIRTVNNQPELVENAKEYADIKGIEY